MDYHTAQSDPDLEKRYRKPNRKERRAMAAQMRKRIDRLKRQGKYEDKEGIRG